MLDPQGGSPLSTQHENDPVGAILADRFRIDRLIGNGGMASVYEATDVALGRSVAVKLFRSDSVDAAGPERQSGEITLLASLNHFALVTLFDAGSAMIAGAPRTFIVMEFIDGPDLRTRIIEGTLESAEVAEYGADLAEALHYVHARDIVHRDVKPANVLLAPSGFAGRSAHAKLADFGIARLLDNSRLTATGTMIGTASYLSPEQALGGAIGPPTDVYSLGLVLLECLTGVRAYQGTAVESAMARLHRQPEIPEGLGQAWSGVLGGMTTRDPVDRLTASDAAVALRDLIAVTPGTAFAARTPPAAGEADPPTLIMPAAAVAATDPITALINGTPLAGAGPSADTSAATTVLPRQSAPGSREDAEVRRAPRRPPRRRRGKALLAVAVVAAAVLAIIAVVLLQRPAEPAATPPDYPAVEGELGTHLTELQESVAP